MEKTAGAALLVIGVVALFAAIVGGGLKVRDIEVGSVPSRIRQGLLAIFGLAIGVTGLALIWDDDSTGAPQPAANLAALEDSNVSDENSVDQNNVEPTNTEVAPVDENGTDTNTST